MNPEVLLPALSLLVGGPREDAGGACGVSEREPPGTAEAGDAVQEGTPKITIAGYETERAAGLSVRAGDR